jgi:hypothetical protein
MYHGNIVYFNEMVSIAIGSIITKYMHGNTPYCHDVGRGQTICCHSVSLLQLNTMATANLCGNTWYCHNVGSCNN